MHARRDWAARFNVVVGLCLIGASVFVVVSGMRPTGPHPDTAMLKRLDAFMQDPIQIDPAKTTGSAVAPLVLVGFIDFDCPACKMFARNVLPELRREFIEPGKLRFSFRHLPIERIHKTAIGAAVAAECAARQGRFWPFHDGLVVSPDRSDNYYQQLAKSADLDGTAFTECQTEAGPDQIRRDVEQATASGLQATPLFFIGRPVSRETIKLEKAFLGTRPFSEFQSTINSLR